MEQLRTRVSLLTEARLKGLPGINKTKSKGNEGEVVLDQCLQQMFWNGQK